jgi:hypothetical protein
MRARTTSVWTRLAQSTSGNATLIMALGMPALIGAAGYGVDMAQLYMWKRELQHSVDQAAIAGAWTLAYDKESTNYQTRARQEFDTNQDRTAGFDTDPVIQLGSYSGGANNSVIVSASASKRLPFSSFLIDKPLFIRARAQATFAEGGNYQACLMALKEGESGTFTIKGSAIVNAKCGLGAMSCEPESLTIDGTATVDTDSIVTCGTVSVPESLDSTVTENASGMENPFEDLPPPAPESESEKSFTCKDGATQYIPDGRYVGGMNMKCTVVMDPGVYVIDGGVLDLTDNKSHVIGTGVMFVLRNGATIKIGGSGNGGYVKLTPMQAPDFLNTVNEPYKDQYADMLVYEDKSGETSETAHVINGNSNITVRGTFYLPNGNVTVNGGSTANPQCFQLWALTLKISGNTTLTTTCDSSETNTAGAAAGGVRLVA